MRLKRGVQCLISMQITLGLLLALTSYTQWLTIERLAGFALLFGTLSAAYHPMRLTIVGRLVARDRIPATVGLNAIAFNTARIIGPALAGVLLASYGTTATLFFGAILYLPYLLLFHSVSLRQRTASTSDGKPWFFAFAEGLKYASRLPVMGPVLLLTIVNGSVGRSLFEILPAVVGDLLHADATTLATLTAAAGAGAVLAGFAATQSKLSARTQMITVISALLTCCLTTLLISLYTTTGLVTVLCLVAGFSTTFVGVSSQTLLQLALADEFRGRVMSLWTMVSFGAPALGALLIGLFADRIGLDTALAAAAATGALACLATTPQAVSRSTRHL